MNDMICYINQVLRGTGEHGEQLNAMYAVVSVNFFSCESGREDVSPAFRALTPFYLLQVIIKI